MNRLVLKTGIRQGSISLNYKYSKQAAILDSGSQIIVPSREKGLEDIPGPKSLPLLGQLLHYTPYIGSLSMKRDFDKHKYLYEKYGSIVRLEGLNNLKSVLLFDPEDFKRAPNMQTRRYKYKKLVINKIKIIDITQYKREREPYIICERMYKGSQKQRLADCYNTRKFTSCFVGTLEVLRNEFFTPIRGTLRSHLYYKKNYMKTAEEQQKPFSLLTEKDQNNWKSLRSAINPLVLKPGVLNSYEEIISDVSDEMVFRLKRIRNENNNINNVYMELSQAAVDANSSVIFGYRIYGMNSNKDSPQRKITEVVAKCLQVAEDLDDNPRYGLWEFIHTPTFNKAIKLYKEHDRLVEYFINESVKQGSTGKGKGSKSVLEKLQEKNVMYGQGFASDTLFGGVFTVSSMMTFILYNLAKNPQVQLKLREEINKNDDDKYLKAVIKESMRVTPVSSRVKRITTREQRIREYLIPKDTSVTMCPHFASVQEDQFPRPLQFLPERWLVDKNHPLYYGNAHPYAYMPFGNGIRMCVAKRLAEMELEKFVKNIIKNFNVTWSSPEQPVVISKQINVMLNSENLQFNDVV